MGDIEYSCKRGKLKIDELPTELLMEIFRFLPQYNNVLLVNKLFYGVGCKVIDRNICLRIDYRVFAEGEDYILCDGSSSSQQDRLVSCMHAVRKCEKLAESVMTHFLAASTQTTLMRNIPMHVYIVTHKIQICFQQNWKWLPSIRNSTRQVAKIVYVTGDWEELPTIISVIKQFSASIKGFKIEWFNGDPVRSQLLEILSLIPNVEHLIFSNTRLTGRTPVPLKNEMSINNGIELRHLKTLELCDVGNNIADVFNYLPVGVLRELRLRRINLDAIVVLFKHQTNIKKLKLEPYDLRPTIPGDIFDNLKMESLELKLCKIKNIATLLSKQTKLKSLTMRGGTVDNDYIEFVLNQLKELQTFSMNVFNNTPSAASVVKISRLAGLKNVSLAFNVRSTDQIRSVAQIHGPLISALEINSGDLDADLIAALAKSVPNLKVLKIPIICDFSTSVAIISHFNFVEVLEIRFPDRMDSLMEIDSFNPKLIELIINFTLTPDFMATRECLVKSMAAYPNLKKLTVSGASITSSLVRRIADGFTRLEWLILTLADVKGGLTVDDIKYLKYHGKKIFFRFDVFKFEYEAREQLTAIYGESICRLRFRIYW